MAISMNMTGMDELLEQVKEMSTGREFKETNKKIVKDGLNLAFDELYKRMPTSKDLSKSGKKGYRPTRHAKENIFGNVKEKNDYVYGLLGWQKDDMSENFYIKFVNYGTTKMKPKDFIQETYKVIDKPIEEIARQYYKKLVERLEK